MQTILFNEDGSVQRGWVRSTRMGPFNEDGENNEMRLIKRADGTVLGAFGRSGRKAGQFHWVRKFVPSGAKP